MLAWGVEAGALGPDRWHDPQKSGGGVHRAFQAVAGRQTKGQGVSDYIEPDTTEPREARDESASAWFAEFRREFAGADPDLLGEIFDYITSNPPESRVSFTADQRKGALLANLEYMFLHPTPTAAFALCYAPNLPFLDHVIQGMTMAEFARKIGVEKEAVRKAVQAVQRHFHYAPRPEQRGEASRARMRRKRIEFVESCGSQSRAPGARV